MKLNPFKPRVALPIIIVVSLFYRLLTFRFKYLLGYDPYLHLAYIEEALKAGEWFNFFTLAKAPWGMQMRKFHPLGLWMIPAYIHKIFNIPLYTAFKITPVIFGVLTVVFTYLALLKLYGERKAFYASLFLGVSYGHVFRSMANYYRGDNYMLFWYSLAFLGIALALGEKRRSWRYRRLIFYLIPGIGSGLASIFWQAYYPIFIFLLGNALLLSFGAFLLREDKYILDGLLLASLTVLGAFMANYLGGKFGYGMFGYDHGLGKTVAEKLSLELSTIKDAFLLVYLKYLVPLVVLGIVILLVVSYFLKSLKARAVLSTFIILLGLLIVLLKFGSLLKDLSTGFGMFKEVPIAETVPPKFSDLWAAFALSLFLSPLFFLEFRRPKVQDFMFLGLIIPSLYMFLTWTRFLFIGSLAVTLMAGIGLISAYERILRKGLALALILLVILPGVNAGVGFNYVAKQKPLINDYWVNALRWLRSNSNENDIVLAWWDYGQWITYYARRAPIAQGSPSIGVALYLLGKLNYRWAESLGVDYVIVSYYDFLKFPAIVATANMHPKYNLTGYALVVVPLVERAGDVFVFRGNGYEVIFTPRKVVVKTPVGTFVPREVYVEEGYKIGEYEYNGVNYLYVNLNYGYSVVMNEKAFNTTLVQLFLGLEKPYKLVYSDGGIVKVFKLEHPNVAVERGNRIILRFINATGTSLGIYGFLDNGTLVFKRGYNVKGKEEFVLPMDLNGSVVVRYVYVKGKTVLDRGVFRVSIGRKIYPANG
uniref:dolichyl-phosphooligosaccharide-protein glycotransferase n=1 Tax=Pyrococcus abyssi (strain GE5 / Orsay) TaxID=272844 RepID=G8ZKI1_PYRAB|nr:TPA: oligosaccharyl transferase, STT3 subunit [Pyrococcus abyssi GE5]